MKDNKGKYSEEFGELRKKKHLLYQSVQNVNLSPDNFLSDTINKIHKLYENVPSLDALS